MPTKTPEPAVAEATPANVIEALALVMSELGGIEKLTQEQRRQRGLSVGDSGERGVKYAYRGIDQIAAAVQPLFAKYGVVCIPCDTVMTVKDITVNNNPWTDTIIHVDWMVYGPNGSSIKGASEGIGRDNSDKGANKAMTAAFKNLLLRLLCIGDPDDDTDHERVEAMYREPEPPPPPKPPKQITALYERMKTEAPGTLAEAELKRLAAENGMKLSVPALAESEQWAAIVRAVLDDPAFDAPVEPSQEGATDA